MYRRKRIEKRYLIGTVVAVILILFIVVVHVMNEKRKLNIVEQSIKDTVLFMVNIVNAPFDFMQDKIDAISEQKDLYKKYKKLEKKVQETDLLHAKNLELERELKNMKELLELNESLSEYAYLNATVINRNLDYWYQTITIDKGTHNGVKVNMPVITSHGLIGKVIKTTQFNSTVKLLTANDSKQKISVKIQVDDEYAYGLLSGYDEKAKTLLVEGISESLDIKEGSLVTTTGMGDIFPSGLLIGKVKDVTTDHFDLAKIVTVKSDVDFDDPSYVTILKRKNDSQ